MAVFKKPKLAAAPIKKRDIPENLWTKCKRCSEIIYNKDLDANLKVCPKCNYHFSMPARERITSLTEPNTFQETDAELISVDVLKFQGVSSYEEKLKEYKKASGQNDAVITGTGKLNGHRISLAVMDFSFLGASMGSVVGEKVTRCIERGTQEGLPVIIVSASGGARMYEGMFSLMRKPAPRSPCTRRNACHTSRCSPIPPPRASWQATRRWATFTSPSRAR
jgi:acetyl-CoA carboxylase carboxyl transferase subunit beta